MGRFARNNAAWIKFRSMSIWFADFLLDAWVRRNSCAVPEGNSSTDDADDADDADEEVDATHCAFRSSSAQSATSVEKLLLAQCSPAAGLGHRPNRSFLSITHTIERPARWVLPHSRFSSYFPDARTSTTDFVPLIRMLGYLLVQYE